MRRDAVQLFVATSAGYGLAILLAPVLSRIYSPTEFGAYAFFGAIACCDVVACLGFDRAIAIAANERIARLLALGACISVFVVAAFNAAIARAGTSYLQGPDWVWWAVAIYVSSYGLVQVFAGLAVRAKRVDQLAVARFSQASTVPLVQLALGFGPKGALSLAVGQIIGQLAGCVAYLSRGAELRFAQFNFVEFRHALISFGHFPRTWAPATLLNSVNLQLSLVGIVMLFGPNAAGLYGFGQRIVGAGVGLVTSAVSQACFTHVAAMVRNDSTVGVLRGHVFYVLRGQAALVVPMVLALTLAPYWAEPLLGSAWRDSAEYFQLMAAPFAVQLVVSPVHVVADALGKPGVHLWREAFRFVATVIEIGRAHV